MWTDSFLLSFAESHGWMSDDIIEMVWRLTGLLIFVGFFFSLMAMSRSRIRNFLV